MSEAAGAGVTLSPHRLRKEIQFHGKDILPGNLLFRHLILIPDTKAGILSYKKNR